MDNGKSGSVNSSEYLFLYGSLMRGLGAMDALSGAAYVRFICEAQIEGQLYDLGDYPGLLTGAGKVRGELYEVLSPQIWSILDPFEGFLADEEHGSLYLRRKVDLPEEAGQAWTYIYNQSVKDCTLIPDGDWRKYWFEKCQKLGV